MGSGSRKKSSEGVELGFKGVEVGFEDGVGGRLLLSRASKGVGGGTVLAEMVGRWGEMKW